MEKLNELPEPSPEATAWVKSIYGGKGLSDPWPRLLALACDAGYEAALTRIAFYQ